MTLNRYLKRKKMSPGDFAEWGGFTIYAVRKWIYGQRIPEDINKVKIAKLTKGAVPTNIWLKGIKG